MDPSTSPIAPYCSLYEAFDAARQRAADLPFLAESALSGGQVWTFAEAGETVDALTNWYAAAGWGQGHRIALGVGNHPRHFFHFLALNRLGASIVPLNPDHRGAEIRHALTLSGAHLVVAIPARAAVIRDAVSQLAAFDRLPIVEMSNPDTVHRDVVCPAAPGVTPPSVDMLDREAAILFTSGTSGAPKGCVLSNRYVLTAGAWYRDLGGLLALRPRQDRLFNPLPVFHMNCGMTSIATMCLTDNCLVLPDRFHATNWWEDCVRSEATAIHYLGIMPPALSKQAPTDWERAHRIRFGLGAGCDPTLHQPFEQRFGFPLVEVWGMTETGRFLANQHEPRLVDTRAFGRAAAPLEVRVVDDQDHDVPDGTSGEMVVRACGDNPRMGFFSGYLNDEAATRNAWRGGWFHTGDVVCRDASGMLYFVDRRKDMIRRSGENISASEVEATLAVHPVVERVAVMAVPDAMRDEEVLAVIVLTPGTPANQDTALNLVRYCLGELAYYKAPGWVVFRESLPVTATNKLQKNRIFSPDENPTHAAFDGRHLKKRDVVATPFSRPTSS